MIRISLEAARVNAKLTQAEAARRLGVSEKTLWAWQNGNSVDKITWPMLDKIEALYGIPRDNLILHS